MDLKNGILRFLERVPQKYKSGDWHPAAHLVLVSFSIWLLCTAEWAADDYRRVLQPSRSDEPNYPLQQFRLFFALYMLVVVLLLVRVAGAWPLASYTVLSWNLLSMRLLFAYLGSGTGNGWCQLFARCLRFPALVGACVTFSVWWIVLVPTIFKLLEEDKSRQRGFLAFNVSPLLLNLHLINLPIAVGEFYMTNQLLSFVDLWIGFVVALSYILFYLNVLDARGLHFYIVFTPRTPFALVTYPSVLLLYYFFFSVANSIVVVDKQQ